MWWTWPSLAFLPCTVTTPRGPKPFRRPPRPWGGADREFGARLRRTIHTNDGTGVRRHHIRTQGVRRKCHTRM